MRSPSSKARKARPDLTRDTLHNSWKSVVERRCIVTGEVLGIDHLIRFAVTPEGLVVPDVMAKLPGRGMWVTARRCAVEEAVAKNKFSRSAKARLSTCSDLAETTEARLRRRALDILGLARKAGLVISGLTRIDEKANSTRSSALEGFVHASDGGLDGNQRLIRLAKGRPLIELFSREQLSLALGGENVVHAALITGGLTESFLKEAKRLDGFLSGSSREFSKGAEQRVA